MELAGAGTGAGALDICDDFGRRRALAAGGEGGGRDADLLVGLFEEGVDGGGLGGHGGEGASLGWALGARVGGGWDRLWAFGGHGGRVVLIFVRKR